jgi:hypothetical protein
MTTLYSNGVNSNRNDEGKDIGHLIERSYYQEGSSVEQSLPYPWGSSKDFYSCNNKDNRNNNSQYVSPDKVQGVHLDEFNNDFSDRSEDCLNSEFFSPVKIVPSGGAPRRYVCIYIYIYMYIYRYL